MLEVGRHVVLMSILAIVLQFRMFVYSQDSIAFSPDRAPCMGERVEMVCYVEPPPSETFVFIIASVSFNGSSPATLAQINADETVGGIDLTRYSANTDGLTTSAARPAIRLVIDSYLPSDSDTLFGCHGVFPNTSASDAIVSGMIMGQADPPSPPVSLTADYNSSTCSGTIQLVWTPGASDRDIEMYFLSLNGVLIASLGLVTSYNHPTTLQRDMEYTYSVVAMSCAGNSTETPATSISVGNPPSPPVSLTADFNSPTCSGSVQLVWTPGASDRDIQMYFLSLNGVLIASLGLVTSYNHPTTLQRNMEYTYSVVAMSCAGNSTETPATSISVGSYSLSDGNPPFFLSYDNSTSNLSVDWTLLPLSPLQSILINYSLVLNYTHSQSDNITNFSNSTFQQLSTDTDYTVPLTPHPFSTDDGVVTNITVCLQITQQCGLSFSGVNMCAFFNSENPPTTTPPTTPTMSANTTAPTSAPLDILPIIIGSVAGVGAILLILIIVLFFIMIYVCCIRNRASRSPKDPVSQGDRVELATHHTPDSRPEDTYAQVNKPSPSNRPSQKKAAPPPPDLIYAELDHMANSTRVNPSSIPVTNYSDLAQLPDYTTDHTTYATLN